MEFTKEFLLDCVYGELNDSVGDIEVIENKLIDNSRWSLHYRMIFRMKDQYYETFYSRGSTEYQDESPYEYDGDMIECYEVVPVEKKVIVYERK